MGYKGCFFHEHHQNCCLDYQKHEWIKIFMFFVPFMEEKSGIPILWTKFSAKHFKQKILFGNT